MCISWRINNIGKYVDLSGKTDKDMVLGLLDGSDGGEYNSDGFEEISKLFAM